MKKVFAFVLTAAVLLSLAACSTAAKTDRADETPAAEQTQTDNTQIPNPWADYDSLDEAIAAAGFDCTIPDTIGGCSEQAFRVLAADGQVKLAIWQDGGYTYAVSVEAGCSADAMAELVSQIG